MADDDTGWEHNNPTKWCRNPHCRHTNWGGYRRLHYRGTDCPPYDPNPEPNHAADFWEAIREQARGNARKLDRDANPTDT